MGKGNGKVGGRGPARRRRATGLGGAGGLGGRTRPRVEALEDRRLLAIPGSPPPAWVPTTANLHDVNNGPLAKAGAALITTYFNYQNYLTIQNHSPSFAASVQNTQAKTLQFQGDSVGVDVSIFTDAKSSYADAETALKNLGMQVTATDAQQGIVEGFLPIAELPTVVALRTVDGYSLVAGISPIYRPITSQQGIANSESDHGMLADAARQQFGVDGTGVNVGVLSDSVSEVGGGLAASVATGDLPANVQVLQDQPAGTGTPTDEGRAMLEIVHDIAPGAKLAFATAATGEAGFASNINALKSQANDNIIVDDVTYPTEPFFQDGIVSQAVTNVTAQGATYFSSANNFYGQGFSSPFRAVNTTVTGLGSGTFMNFDPNGGTNPLLPVTVNTTTANGDFLEMQFDQPFYSSNGVTSHVNMYLLDSTGKIVSPVGTDANQDNIASQLPYQIFANIPAAGQYFLAVQVVAGPAPNYVRVQDVGDGNVYQFSHQYGSSGGITYPTTLGHETAAGTLDIGAIPWYNTPAWFTPPGGVVSEPFSATGPALITLAPDGSRLSTPEVRLDPTVSAPDGVSTSFFGSPTVNTTNPPTGTPTPTNLNPDPTLLNFFGTSAAAPAAAAVAALMKQVNASATTTDIRAAMIQSAQPINGNTAGNWEPKGGYGLINAVSALTAVDQLRVTSTTPAAGSTLTTVPTSITVHFNKPIVVSTLSAADLNFTAAPAGVAVAVGAPVELDQQTFQFPITLNVSNPTVNANGNYTYTVGGSVQSVDGKPLVSATETFKLADTTSPTITSVELGPRVVVIQFSAPMRASTFNLPFAVELNRANNPLGFFNNPNNVDVLNDPGAVIFYDAPNNRLILDLTKVSQANLPTDHYALVVSGFVTDAVGNQLDGAFSGTFPSGDGQPGSTFVEDLGTRALNPPQVLSFGLDPASDSGIPNDRDTNVVRPTLDGFVYNVFPGSNAGLTVVAEFGGLHNGALTLAPGTGGIGFTGTVDVSTTTDAGGNFKITAPADLPDGFQTVRVVVVGASTSPVVPGQSAQMDTSFQIESFGPIVVGSSIPAGAKLSSLQTITLSVASPVAPSNPNSPFAVPVTQNYPALDPATADNTSSYQLLRIDAAGNVLADESSFIKSATFTDLTQNPRPSPIDWYSGQVALTFSPGLPTGEYKLVMRSPTTPGAPGVTDAAGNALQGQAPTSYGAANYALTFFFQPQPAYVTNYAAISTALDGSMSVTGPRADYEVPIAGVTPRASAPPTEWTIDFSNPINKATISNNSVWVVGSADTVGGTPDGNFGDLGMAGGNDGKGYSVVPGSTVTVTNSVPGAVFGQPGFQNRLVIRLAAGTTLPPDYYRLYIPNAVVGGKDLRISDQFGNQIDGEFTGDQTASGSWETLQPTGQYRPGLSGDGLPGGAFETGFVVVPNGNVIFARADYQEDPLRPSTYADGSLAKPYPVLAPEGDPALSSNLNDPINFSHFNQAYNRSGSGHFDLSAFYAAQVLAANGPVIVIALPSARVADPLTGAITQLPFVLQAPAGSNPVLNDGSASVPADTTMVFTAGTSLKLFNASLYVQNQGSALQLDGTGNQPTQQVIFTSYLNDAVGGDTNHDGSNTTPRGGDWGGIVFRNFDQVGRTDTFAVDGTLKNAQGGAAIAGSDEGMSILEFANISFAGGAVPATNGFRFDAVTNFNNRAFVTNTTIANTGGGGGSQGAISGDMDSFRTDALAMGILARRDTLSSNSINGIYLRANLNGLFQASDAVSYPSNPTGGAQEYGFFAPLPYVLTSEMVVGQDLVTDGGGAQLGVNNRADLLPGTMFKFQHGSSILVTPSGSINVGDQTYIHEFDANNNVGPADTGFKSNSINNAPVLFTSLFDSTASTAYKDPLTGVSTTIVAPIDSANQGPNSPLQPTPTNVPNPARWGAVRVESGGVAVVNNAIFQYGGGSVNIPNGTIGQVDVLNFEGAFATTGTHAMVTNNTFQYNLDTPIGIDPNGLLAADPQRPLKSGHPFFRGNILVNNAINGLGVRAPGLTFSPDGYNASVSELWDATDITYVLRGTIVMRGVGSNPRAIPLPSTTALAKEIQPSQVITLQSALPGTLMANGQTIAQPGESLIVKLLGGTPPGTAAAGSTDNTNAGAGFIVGVDNGVDPTSDPALLDSGLYAQLRILGIGGNQTTGQARVPVVITSLHDSTVGTTVRGVKMFQAITGDTTAPTAGDGGLIYIGSLSLSEYNPLDPREGSRIDNADIRYLTRIEVQGGGFQTVVNADGQQGYAITDGAIQQHWGVDPTTGNVIAPLQQNQSMVFTITDSNLANFSQVGVLSHPGFNELVLDVLGSEALVPSFQRIGLRGEPVDLLLINDTIANMPVGVRTVAETAADTNAPEPFETVLLNNTFFNDALGVDIIAPTPSITNYQDHVNLLAMDNIFDGSTTAAVQLVGRTMNAGGQTGQGQYNLYWNNKVDVNAANSQGWANNQPVAGDPMFRDAANLNFNLMGNSAAIDASRSELQATWGTDLFTPIVSQVLGIDGGIIDNTPRQNDFSPLPTTELMTLPGYPLRTYYDEWVPAVPNTPGAFPGPATLPGSFWYIPIGGNGPLGPMPAGERDQLGNLRIDDPNKPNVGFGSRPFFDIGAFEYIQQFPAHIVDDPASGGGVAAVITNPASPTGTSVVNVYKVGGVGGVNKVPQSIQVKFDHELDPNTINGQDVLLEASGGDGIFGNGNSAQDRSIDLTGKLSFDPSNDVLTVNLNGLSLGEDQYRLVILGTGATVVRDLQGLPIDGANLDANGNQRALPSGTDPTIYPAGLPGSNFQMTFSIITQPPSVVAGSLVLDPASDTNIVGDRITKINTPTFDGKITDPEPLIDPLGGQTVTLYASPLGNGVFSPTPVGTGVTAADGSFSIKVSTPLPDSAYNVGADGLLGDPGTGGYTIIKAIVTDPAGNSSNPNDLNATTNLDVDTRSPLVTASTPLPNQEATVTNNSVTISLSTNENIDPRTLVASNIVVQPVNIVTGALGTAIPVSNIQVKPLKTTPQGPELISFTITGAALTNGIFQLHLANAVTDLAGNSIQSSTGGAYTLPFVIFSPALEQTIWVGTSNGISGPSGPLGNRLNPYPTIAQGLAAAAVGDTVAVLPGVYSEAVTLEPLVHLVSASFASTATTLVPGNALATVIRAPAATNGRTISVTGSNLISVPDFATEIRGFAISTPLVGDPATGTIDGNSIGLLLNNSNVLVDKNYFVDSGAGALFTTAPNNGPNPTFQDNVFAGNLAGLVVNDAANPSQTRQLAFVVNNDFVFNTYGVEMVANANAPETLDLASNIFWQNNDRTSAQNGTAIVATNPNPMTLNNNLFYLNHPGANPAAPTTAFETFNVVGFDPSQLRATPDINGNFYGNPSFVFSVDPRPNFDGPARFFLNANFDLTLQSAAIDNALNVVAPATDLLSRGRVKVSGHGFGLPGYGPADVGAFEFAGTPPTGTGTGSGSSSGTGTGSSSSGPGGIRGLTGGQTTTPAASSTPAITTQGYQAATTTAATGAAQVATPPAQSAPAATVAIASATTTAAATSPVAQSSPAAATTTTTTTAGPSTSTPAPTSSLPVAPAATVAAPVVTQQLVAPTPLPTAPVGPRAHAHIPAHVARDLAIRHRGVVPRHPLPAQSPHAPIEPVHSAANSAQGATSSAKSAARGFLNFLRRRSGR
ncbi:MAG TPA: Ig-like domain-containing protein [Isosphaeraceae bacterium]|jgi:hypothetical protein|nr:Ig-like domain-containing protein [Isosphaeraceae bacterium]